MNYSTYFLLSLIETNKTRLLVASLLALAMFIPLDLFFRFGFLHYLPKSFIVRGPHDFYANAAHGASEARFLPEAVTPIYVFGGSGMREAMLVGPELGRIVTDNAGHQQQFHSYVLTNIQRSFANDLAALDLIEAKPGIIVYGLSFIRFGMGSKAFDRQLQGHQIIGRNRQFIEYMETQGKP